MSSSPAVHGATVADEADDFPDPGDLDRREKKAEPRDPALLAACRMLVDAIDRPSDAAETISRAGSVVVIRSPSLLWSPYLLRSFADVAGGAWKRMRLTYIPSSNRPDRWNDRSDKPSWALRIKTADALDEKEILEAVWLGVGVLVATDDLSWLPQSVRDAADVVLEVEPPGAGALLAASGVCAEGADVWPHGVPVGVTPGMIRAAFRKGSPLLDCHDRMLRLLQAVAQTEPVTKQKSRWTLDSLHGMGAVSDWARSLASDVAAWRSGEIPWSEIDPGCMIVGAPGTGKTTLARCISDAAGLRFMSTSYAEWESGKGGADYMLSKRMKAVFDDARSVPTLLFIDELDSLPSREAGRHNDTWFRVITNSLLECLDGAGDRGEVIVVGAANSVDNIDPAILRAGRLDRVFRVPLPDRAALERIILEYVPELPSPDARALARRMAGKTGADVSQFARDARRLARRAGRPVCLSDLLQGLAGDIRSTWERRLAALHEAGHAVAAEAIRAGSLVAASIADDERRSGGVQVTVSPTVQNLEYIECRCIVGLSGRAAEQVITGGVTSAAGGSRSSDLAMVSAELVRARMALGLVDRMAWHGEVSVERAGRLVADRPDLADWVDARIAALYGQALALVGDHQDQVEAVAAALLDRETLDGNEVREILVGAGLPQMRG